MTEHHQIVSQPYDVRTFTSNGCSVSLVPRLLEVSGRLIFDTAGSAIVVGYVVITTFDDVVQRPGRAEHATHAEAVADWQEGVLAGLEI